MTRLHRLSAVTEKDDATVDSVKRRRAIATDDRARAHTILFEAQRCYSAMYQFRKDRERNKRYNYGDQWGDMVTVDGERMTEAEYIRRQGNVPLKTNLIRRLTRDVTSVFRSQNTEPTCIARDRDEQQNAEIMSTVLQYNMELNHMSELYARSMEEYLISGMVVHRKWYGWRNDKLDCWTDHVQPNCFFIDTNMKDYRSWDCALVGEIHDIGFDELCSQFANSPADYKRLANIYAEARNHEHCVLTWEQFGHPIRSLDMDFLVPRDASRCRVIEVWRKETKPRYRCHDYNTGEIYKIDECDYDQLVKQENDRRRKQGLDSGMLEEDIPFIKAEWFVDSLWYFYYLSPMGDILAEGETPYAHKGHPYVFKAYPFIDGEIHSFVSDVIDQQRYTNRLITLNDWIIRASAKGVLMVPDECIPEGVSPEEFADTWTQFNGVVVYTPGKSGKVPQQVSSNSTNIGLHEMLSMQIKFFEEISGVQSALQGKTGYSGTSAALYAQQTQNATTSLLDILDSFNEFVHDAAVKDLKNIQQFYDQKRTVEIAGNRGARKVYDPDKIRNIELDVSIVPSQSTPAYRAISNDILMELFRAQAISIEQLLQVGAFPFADELLQSINSQKAQMEQGQSPDGVSPELLQRVQGGADQQAVAQLEGAVR